MNKKNFALSVIALMLFATMLVLAGCAWSNNQSEGGDDTRIIIDNAGREVSIPNYATRIAAMNGPAYEMVFMLGGADRIAMTKSGHTTDFPVALLLNPNLANIPGIGANPSTSVNIEDYLKNEVDVVLYYNNDTELKKFETANVPVMVVAAATDSGSLTSTDKVEEIKAMSIDEYVYEKSHNVEIVADMLGEDAVKEYQAWRDYNKMVAEKLYERTKDLKDEDRPTVYWGNTWGENVLATCDITSHYYDVMLAGGTFVAPLTAGGNFPEVTAEQLFDWDPDIIVVDNHGNYPELVIKAMQKENSQWQSLTAVQNNELYRVPTGVFFLDRGTTHSLMLLWLATFVQPELFSDINMIEEVQYYYREFYEYELTDEEAQKVLDGWYEQ